MINDYSRNYWAIKWFQREPCKWKIEIPEKQDQQIKVSNASYYSFGGPYWSLPSEMEGKQLNGWINGALNISEKVVFFQAILDFDSFNFYNFNSTQFITPTFIFNFNYKEYIEYEQKFLEIKDDNSIWFEKKSDWAYGKGLETTVIGNLTEYREQTFKKLKANSQNKTKDWRVIQKNINNYLINGKKAEIRQYVLVASVNPYVVLFHEGFLTTTLSLYRNSVTGNQTQDKINHFATFYTQSKSPLYSEEKIRQDYQIISLTMKEFFDYHLSKGGKQEDIDRFKEKNKDLYAYTFQATQHLLYDNKIGQYHLFGCDIGISKDFSPYLMECNAMPGTTGALIAEPSKQNSREVIWESLSIMTEIFDIFQQKQNQIKVSNKTQQSLFQKRQIWSELFTKPDNLNIRHFEWLYNEATNFNLIENKKLKQEK